MAARTIEYQRLVGGAVLVVIALVVDGHDLVDAVLLFVGALQFNRDVSDLLRLVLPTMVNSK